jgi:hypothetical protein
MVNIIKAFGKSRIIKINTLNNVNTNNKVEPNNEIAPNNEVEPDNEIENNINPEILSLKYINEQNINNIELKLKETMNIIKIKKGHFNRYGVHAGIEKNRIWKINDEGKNIYLMYCEPGELCILDKKSLNIIRKYEKDNKHLKKAVVTGITRIAQESLFSGVNNFEAYSLLREKYGQYFGFTEEEVVKLKNGVGPVGKKVSMEDIKGWYNGYRVGKYTRMEKEII